MYHDSKRTGTAIVLLIKLFVWRLSRHHRCRHRLRRCNLLKRPYIPTREGVEIVLVALCYGNRDKPRPDRWVTWH